METTVTIVRVNLAGSGFGILRRIDEQTWISHSKIAINAAMADRVVDRVRGENRDVTVIEHDDFYGRPPESMWCEGMRIL